MSRVLGFGYKKISIERKKENQISKINTNIEITNIVKKELDLFKGKDILDVSYDFKIIYDSAVAELDFEGSAIIEVDDKNLFKEIISEWKNKKIPEEFRILVMNVVLSRCNLKALQLEEDFNLPPHIPIPRITGAESSSKEK
ncbi:hypothetical protein J4463_00235 [Candidatus Pacearchaeota archaeon]|nr:hypothetical protein [Candidatus Pacearchaeota archaeon]